MGFKGVRGITNAYDISVAQKFNKSAKRNRTNLPARPMSIRNAEQLRTKSERERCNLNLAPSCDQEVAEFMKKNDGSQNKYERDEITCEPKTRMRQTADKIHGADSSAPSSTPAQRNLTDIT